jgi:4-diphosphocytidyl-2C-methyl-D-erythritol kinase
MAEAAHHLAPGIGAAVRLLNESPGVIGSVVAGSGSASFGICEDDATALSAAESAHRAGLWASATRFNKGGCEVHRTT